MNKQDTQLKILHLISESKLAIIDFKEELLELKSFLDLNNPKEEEIMVSMTEDINFIVGTITINCMKLEKLLNELENNNDYFSNHVTDIEVLLKKIEEFNGKVIIKE